MFPSKYALLYGSVASCGYLLLGCQLSLMRAYGPLILKYLHMNPFEEALLLIVGDACASIGAIIAGVGADYIGRRYMFGVAGGVAFVGAVPMVFVSEYPDAITMCCITSFGIGIAVKLAPVYISEMAPPSAKGFLMALPEMFYVLGFILTHASGYGLSHLTDIWVWRSIFIIVSVISLILLFSIVILVESPCWLIVRGGVADATIVINKTTNNNLEVNSRLHHLKLEAQIDMDVTENIQIPRQTHGNGFVWRDLFYSEAADLQSWFQLSFLHLFQQMSIVEASVIYQSWVVYKTINDDASNSSEPIMFLIIFCLRLFFDLCSTLFTNQFRRSRVLLVSIGGVIISLMALGGMRLAVDHDIAKGDKAMSLYFTCLLLFIGFYSMGLGPITWMVGTFVPYRFRSQANGFNITVNRLTDGMTRVIIFPLLRWNVGVTWLIIAIVEIGGVFFTYRHRQALDRNPPL